MGADIFPYVFAERRIANVWTPWHLGEKRASDVPGPLAARQGLADRSYEVLMNACDDACPEGATFADAHEDAYARFVDEVRERVGEEFSEDTSFAEGALSIAELRKLAAGPAPADPHDLYEAGHWDEARAELVRWADVLEASGAERVVYWFDGQ